MIKFNFGIERVSAFSHIAKVDPPLDCCGTPISRVTLTITPQDSTGTGKLQVTAGGAVWEKKDIPPNELSFFRDLAGDNHVLSLVSAMVFCVSPPTIRLQTLPTSLAGCSCVAAADIGCAPGGATSTGIVPVHVDVGQAVRCVDRCDPENPEAVLPPAQAPLKVRPPSSCWDCAVDEVPEYSKNVLTDVSTLLLKVKGWTSRPLRRPLEHGRGNLNLSGGNVMVTLGMPDCGPWHILPTLVYNSQNAATSTRWGNGSEGRYGAPISRS